MLRERWPGWKGKFRVEFLEASSGRLIAQQVIDNLITDVGIDYTYRRWAGLVADPFTHIGVGTDGREAANGDVALYAEALRKAVDCTVTPASLESAVVFTDVEANVTIREIGLFAGAVLVARATCELAKDDQISLRITRVDDLVRRIT